MGNISVVVDTLWGDSGKGKIVDLLAPKADVVVRYAGGSNAGHTIKNDQGTFKLHLVPSGILHKKTLNIIESGVVVNPTALVAEIRELRKAGVSITKHNLRISRRAHLVMPWHILRDQLKDAKSGKSKIGTTGRGIGPTYADRTAREGFRMKDLYTRDFSERYATELRRQNKLIQLLGGKAISLAKSLPEVLRARAFLKEFVDDTFLLTQEYFKQKKTILGEGAQGALLDIALGGFPYVTSSHTGVTGFSLVTGIHDHQITDVIGVTKAYSTRVGGGPMPTELFDADGEKIREVGGEYGATTGRPRRCGWFDLPATRYGCNVSGARSIALMKLDVLDRFKTIKVCIGYRVGTKVHMVMPDMDPDTLENVQTVYKSFKGWMEKTSNIRSHGKLPFLARQYLRFLEKELGLPIRYISVGASREQTITVR